MTTSTVTSSFTKTFAGAFYDRMEDSQFTALLESSSEFVKANADYQELESKVLSNLSVQEQNDFLNQKNRLRDMLLQYCYRIGVQDGLALTRTDFPVKDI